MDYLAFEVKLEAALLNKNEVFVPVQNVEPVAIVLLIKTRRNLRLLWPLSKATSQNMG